MPAHLQNCFSKADFHEQAEQERILNLGERTGLDCSRLMLEGWLQQPP